MNIEWMIRYDGRYLAKNNLFRCSGQIDLDEIISSSLNYVDSDLEAKIRVTSLIEEVYADEMNIPMKIELLVEHGYNSKKRICKFKYKDNVIDRLVSFRHLSNNSNMYNVISCIDEDSKKDIQKLIDLVYQKTIKVRQELFG